ncbi:hypothetical protein Y699_01619 [Aspergillus fumigatus Z5]|nr:hypothetical protein Y699_01619 [Aspergillus fumigatus Z5]
MSQIMRLLVSQPLHWLLALAATASASSSVDYTQYVNALMGLERPFSCKGYGGGDIFVGGARPFGMVKLGTDTTAANRSIAVLNGGWTPGGNVTAIISPELVKIRPVARSFIRSEIPSWRLTDTVKDAVEQWNKEVLNKTQLPLDRTANMAHVRLLYSSLYFMHPMPSNRTGDNPLWRKESLNVTELLDPKFSNGTFNNSAYDPMYCYECEWQSHSFEGVPWEYSCYSARYETLIDFMGALETFEAPLDTIPGTAICSFKETPYGVPGNSDAGAMNSWLVWQMLGLYPLASQPVYRSISPWFPELNMTVNGNQTLGLKRRPYVCFVIVILTKKMARGDVDQYQRSNLSQGFVCSLLDSVPIVQ